MAVANIKEYEITGRLVIDLRARKWCKLPYGKSYDKNGKIKRKRDGSIKYSHPEGCPNYDKQERCPPKTSLDEHYLDINDKHWVIVFEFDMKSHIIKRKKKFPHYTMKQCRNVLHWHGKAKKKLRLVCEAFCKGTDRIFTLTPEGKGIHVIKTAKNLGIPIKAKCIDTIYLIALVGYPKTGVKRLDYFFGSE